jgi:hypothetical protein
MQAPLDSPCGRLTWDLHAAEGYGRLGVGLATISPTRVRSDKDRDSLRYATSHTICSACASLTWRPPEKCTPQCDVASEEARLVERPVQLGGAGGSSRYIGGK